MTTKKPDRFARVVKKEFDHRAETTHFHPRDIAVTLLRREHRAVVRLIHQLRLRARKAAFDMVLANKCPEWHDAKIEVLDDLLAALARRAR
jgi:hypothetical protein